MAVSSGAFEAESISLEEALQRCDSRGHHARKVLIVSCAACMCGGMSGAVGPFLMTPIPTEGNYTTWATSLLASSTFAGMWAGSVLGGLACDAIGPGRVMTGSLVLLTIGGAAPIYSPSIAIAARTLCGIALCSVYQAANTYVAEWVATSRRSTYLSMLHVWIAVGGVVTTLLAVALQTQQAGYRVLLGINSTPPLLVLVLTFRFVSLSEAPRWLLVTGAPGTCDKMLRRIARSGGGLAMTDAAGGHGGGSSDDDALPTLPKIVPSIEAAPSAEGSGVGLPSTRTANSDDSGAPPAAASRRFTPRARCIELLALWRLHAFGMALSFCLNFGSKGSEIWVGKYVEAKGLASISRVIYLCTAFGKICGDILNMRVSRRLGRLRCLQIGFGACALTTFGFVMPMPTGASAVWLLSLAFLQGVGMDLLWCNLYIYLVERFPTTVRSTGFGVAMGLGRAGGVISSALGNLMPSMDVAFIGYGVSFLVGLLVALRPAVETARRSLVDSGAA